jgi:DNA-binding GntR family transcriptional regulator
MTKNCVSQIREDILAGKWLPGDALKQEEIADKYQISRQPVRAALQVLAAEGWAVDRGRRGLVVAPLSAQEAEDLYLMRCELEVLALRLAAPHWSNAALGLAEDYLEAMKNVESVGKLGQLNWQFHRALYESSARTRLLETVDRLYRHAERYLSYQFNVIDNRAESHREHRQLLDACKKRDIDRAEQLLRAHVSRAGIQLAQVLSRKVSAE